MHDGTRVVARRAGGRSKTTWRRTVVKERIKAGWPTWSVAKVKAQNRKGWADNATAV